MAVQSGGATRPADAGPSAGGRVDLAPDVRKRLLVNGWLARRIRTGTFSINGGNYFGADAPLGGYKQSGIGRETGVAGFEEFLERKTYAQVVA